MKTHNIWKLDCQKATFRSSQTPNSLPSGTFIPQGQAGITSTTNRFEYFIRYNEFTNISNCINIPIAAGQYTTSTGNKHGVYSSYIGVIQNTFAAATATNEFISAAVNISCANNFTAPAITNTNVSPPASGIFVKLNEFNNVFRAVNVNGNLGLQTEVSSNTIQLKPDNVFSTSQYGVKVTNCFASNTGGYFTTVHENIAAGSGTATPNPLETLFFGSMNSGTNSPRHTCNELSEAYAGFTFDNYNNDEIWAGNVMQPLTRGLVLTNFGEIGQQGDNGTSAANVWDGTWQANTHYGTYVATTSTAGLSPLWCPNNNFYPLNNDGNAPIGDQYHTSNGNLLSSSGGDYNCIGIPNNITIPIPEFDKYGDATQFSIAENMVYRNIYLDPDITGPGYDLHDYFVLLAESKAAEFMNVENALFMGDYSNAIEINNAIDVEENNECETAYHLFYELYARYLAALDEGDSFANEDSSALYGLAALCPATNGPAVYQAHALYNKIFGVVYQFGECGEGAGERRKDKLLFPSASDLGAWRVIVSPNPFRRDFTITTNKDDTQLFVVVSDVSGRRVYEGGIPLNKRACTLSLSLSQGMYFLDISNPEGESSTQKIICSD